MQRIADEAGVARSTIYLYFKEKNALLLRLTAGLEDGSYERMSNWTPDQPDALDRLAGTLLEVIRYYRERAHILRATEELAGQDTRVDRDAVTARELAANQWYGAFRRPGQYRDGAQVDRRRQRIAVTSPHLRRDLLGSGSSPAPSPSTIDTSREDAARHLRLDLRFLRTSAGDLDCSP
jgi:AcrR family transcriptional regulator